MIYEQRDMILTQSLVIITFTYSILISIDIHGNKWDARKVFVLFCKDRYYIKLENKFVHGKTWSTSILMSVDARDIENIPEMQ